MKGYLISYREELTKKDITLINYYLFGRIVHRSTKQRKKDHYYYPGLFEWTTYARLANGCYFTERIVDDFDKRLVIYEAEIDVPKDKFQTSREHWKKFIVRKEIRVRNF